MHDATGVSKFHEADDLETRRRILEEQKLLSRALPGEQAYIVAVYIDGIPDVTLRACTRSKIFESLGVDGSETDQPYAVVSTKDDRVCSNDNLLLDAANSHLDALGINGGKKRAKKSAQAI